MCIINIPPYYETQELTFVETISQYPNEGTWLSNRITKDGLYFLITKIDYKGDTEPNYCYCLADFKGELNWEDIPESYSELKTVDSLEEGIAFFKEMAKDY